MPGTEQGGAANGNSLGSIQADDIGRSGGPREQQAAFSRLQRALVTLNGTRGGQGAAVTVGSGQRHVEAVNVPSPPVRPTERLGTATFIGQPQSTSAHLEPVPIHPSTQQPRAPLTRQIVPSSATVSFSTSSASIPAPAHYPASASAARPPLSSQHRRVSYEHRRSSQQQERSVASPSGAPPQPRHDPSPLPSDPRRNPQLISGASVNANAQIYGPLFAIAPGKPIREEPSLIHVVQGLASLSAAGGFKVEKSLETSILILLSRAQLPTNAHSLRQFEPHLRETLTPGMLAKDYLVIFQTWQYFTFRCRVVTFPITGPLVAAFLWTPDTVKAEDRAKVVFVLEQYRKCTVGAYIEWIRTDEQLQLMREWTGEERRAWVRYIEMAQVPLGEWFMVKDGFLSPDHAENRSHAATTSTSTSTSTPMTSTSTSTWTPIPNADPTPQQAVSVQVRRAAPAPSLTRQTETTAQTSTFAPRKHPLPANPSLKALGKRPQGEGSPHSPVSSASPPPPPPPPPPHLPLQPEPAPDSGGDMAPEAAAPQYGFTRLGQPRRRPFYKRKLPPEERRADEEFYVAVRDCAAALSKAREIRVRSSSRPSVPTIPRTGSSSARLPAQPPSPSPYADYIPLSCAHGPSPAPILAHVDISSAFATTLPSNPAAFRLTSTALGVDLGALRSVADGTAPHSAKPTSHPRVTLTPHLFLPYPKCLSLPQQLSPREQQRTFAFATDLDGSLGLGLVELEKKLVAENVGADEREVSKQRILTRTVRDAIARGKPTLVEGTMVEVREPVAAAKARKRAARYGVKPVYCFTQPASEGSESRKAEASPTQAGLAKLLPATDGTAHSLADQAETEKGSFAATSKEEAPSERKRKREHAVEQSGEGEAGSIGTTKQSSETPRIDIQQPLLSGHYPTSQPGPEPSPTSANSSSEPPLALKTASSHLRRPSLSSNSASAPAVPQQVQRNRSNSNSQEPPNKMRRQASAAAGGGSLHPLALLYATQSPQFRQGARLKAATIVAATKNGIIPASKSPLIAAKILTEGAVLPKQSPRIGSSGLAPRNSPRNGPKPLSPPLIPIPLPAEKQREHIAKLHSDSNEATISSKPDAMQVDIERSQAEFERLHPPATSSQGSSALGVVLELPSLQPPPPPPVPTPTTSKRASPAAPGHILPIPIPSSPSAALPSPRSPEPRSSLENVPEPNGQEPAVTSLAGPATSTFSRLVGTFTSSVARFVGAAVSPTKAVQPQSSPKQPSIDAASHRLAPSYNSGAENEVVPESPLIPDSPSSAFQPKDGVNPTAAADVTNQGSTDLDDPASTSEISCTPDSTHGASSDRANKSEHEQLIPNDSPARVGPLNNHPLRKTPKSILSVSEPYFPFGRLH
ncbi:uncharacterized protein JCM15063_003660 [Sporobolomyces koalae]|uniref:uncharacterized protein n=1 Tax=Sporobolomyces koalae TaxID=500713 RepID=UPI00316C3AF0